MPANPGDLTLLYRVRSAPEILFRNELDALAQQRGARIHYLIGPRSEGVRDPLDATSLTRLVPDIGDRDVYLCGPVSMMQRVEGSLHQLGLPKRQIHAERFAY